MNKRKVCFLAKKMFKTLKGTDAPNLCTEMFLLNEENRHKQWNCIDFAILLIKSIRNEIESLSYLGIKIKAELRNSTHRIVIADFAKHTCQILLLSKSKVWITNILKTLNQIVFIILFICKYMVNFFFFYISNINL